jgi:TRAP-type C4-dicarboxylate transport system permease small subunit
VLLLADLLCLAFLAVFVYQGTIVAKRVLMLGQFSPSMPWLPIGVTYAAIPVGCFFMFCNVVVYAARHLRTAMTGKGEEVYNPHEI